MGRGRVAGGGAVARDDRLAHADDDGDVWLPGEDEIIVPEEHEGFQMSEEWLALFAATERRREAKVRERRREAGRRGTAQGARRGGRRG